MAEPYRSSVTAAELQRAERPTGVLAHLLHAIAPPRTNKAYDKNKAAGEGNLPYAEPGFFRRLAGDPGRTWNQLAQEDASDLGVTRSLAEEEHGRAAQLLDKDLTGRSAMLDKQLASADTLASKNAGNEWALHAMREAGLDTRQMEENIAAQKRAETMSQSRTDPNLSEMYKQNAEYQKIINNLTRGSLNQKVAPAKKTIWQRIFGGGPEESPAPTMTPDGSEVAEPNSPALIPKDPAAASIRPAVSTGTPMGMSEGNAAYPSPWNMLASTITGMDSPHHTAYPSPWKAAKKILGVKTPERPPVSVASR
jgi:hypothetical protein